MSCVVNSKSSSRKTEQLSVCVHNPSVLKAVAMKDSLTEIESVSVLEPQRVCNR